MRAPSYLSLAALCFAACSVDVAGSMPDDGGGFLDGGGFDSGGPWSGVDGGSTVDAGVEACTGTTPQTRLRFEQAQVVAPAVCNSETQKRTCSGGNFTAWSGTFSSETCELAPYASCGNVMHGAQEKRTRYQELVSVTGCKKEEQTRTCNDGEFGDWTGDYEEESCALGFLGECALFGGAFTCESGTTCMYRSGLSASCLGNPGHACVANNDCLTSLVCAGGTCGIKSAPAGSCDEQSDCATGIFPAGCGNNNTVSCAQNSCRCSDASSCSNNDQCLGTCVSSKCVQANTTCDNTDDCRDAYQCKTPAGKTKGCYLPDGQVCTANASCEHVCRGALCAAAGKANEDCDENVDCGGNLVCRSSKCAAPGTISQPCDENADCASGYACGPYMAGAITYNACLIASGGACGTSDVACASGVCSSSGMGPTGICQ